MRDWHDENCSYRQCGRDGSGMGWKWDGRWNGIAKWPRETSTVVQARCNEFLNTSGMRMERRGTNAEDIAKVGLEGLDYWLAISGARGDGIKRCLIWLPGFTVGRMVVSRWRLLDFSRAWRNHEFSLEHVEFELQMRYCKLRDGHCLTCSTPLPLQMVVALYFFFFF